MRVPVIKPALDGNDRSVDAHALLALIGFVALLAFQAYATYRSGEFSAEAFGQGVGLILGGGGVMGAGQAFLDRSKPRGQHVDNPD